MQPVVQFQQPGRPPATQPPAAASSGQFYAYQPHTPQQTPPAPAYQPMQQQSYGTTSWDQPAPTSATMLQADTMSGSMSGYMAAAPPPNAPSSISSSGFGQAPPPSIARSISAALIGEGEADEPPILIELGIDFQHIKEKTKLVLWPKRAKLASDSPIVLDDDFAGPLLFCLVLATLLVFQGKIYFGNIYGVFLVGLLGTYATLNLMSLKGIDMLRTASVMGYCLLPIVFLAALSIPFEMRGLAGAICIPLAVLWCANAASLFFVAALDADDRRWLLAYPVALFYTCFALITVF